MGGKAFLSLIVGVALCASAFADRLALGVFKDGDDGFGEGSVVPSGEGWNCLKLLNKDPKGWVETAKSVPPQDFDFKALRFKVRLSPGAQLAVRLDDSTGQSFLQRPELKADGSWEELSINAFDKGPQLQSWGGAADCKWHPPASQLAFVLEGKGELSIGQVFAELQDSLLPQAVERRSLLKAAKSVSLGSFESGRDSFEGALEVDPKGGPDGGPCALVVNDGDSWVEAKKALPPMRNDMLEFSMRVRSSDLKSVAVRFVDAKGQSFQQRLEFPSDGAWHELKISKFNEGQIWGGPEDKAWHPPAGELFLIVEQKGSLRLDSLKAKLRPEPLPSIATVECSRFGNVFVQGETPSFKIDSSADEISYEVKDYAGKLLKSGTLKDVNGALDFKPDVEGLGFFSVHLSLKKGGAALSERDFDFGVMRSFDGVDMKSSPFRAMTHFAQGWNVDMVPLMPKYGVAGVRDELYWDEVETKKGVFSFDTQDVYMKRLASSGIEPLIVMSFANKLYDNGDTPRTKEGFDAYARYGKEILRHYGSQVKTLEIWNEYNGSFCSGPAAADRPKSYAEIVKAVYPQLKEERPSVNVIGCAPVLIPLPYFEGVFANGGLKAMDGVVIHPYRGRPEGVEREIAELRELMRKYGDGKEKPVWCTEYGYGVWSCGSLSEVAKYLVRTSVLMRSQGVEAMYWYLFSDYSEFKTMGLVQLPESPRGRHAPNPAGPAFANMAWLLHDAAYELRLRVSQFSRCHVHKFRKASGEEIRVCWATSPSAIDIEAGGKLVKCDLMGNESVLLANGGKLRLPVDDAPFYLLGEILSEAEAPSDEAVVADSLEEYSKTQGGNGWSYGFYDGSGQKPYSGEDFKEMRIVQTVWGEKWGSEHEYLSLWREGVHPGLQNGKPLWAVRRWKSPVEGRLRVEGRITGGDSGSDGVGFVVMVDGAKAFERVVTPEDCKPACAFKLEIDVKNGSIVDFCVNPGPKGSLDFDSVAFDARMLMKAR